MRKITEIILHCTATEPTNDIHVADIRRCHKERGFSDIGYHYLINLNGDLEFGRPVEIVGAHCLGHNANSIGIAYAGGIMNGKPEDTRTQRQKDAITSLVFRLIIAYPYITGLHGHNEYAAKACPCFDVQSEFMGIHDALRLRAEAQENGNWFL